MFNLSRLIYLWLALLALAPFASAKPSHVIFLFADDMRADSIAALGNSTVKTPNLDALVKRGLSFKNAYCFGGNSGAVCLPSRNMLLSGNTYFRWEKQVAPTMPKAPKGNFAPATDDTFPAIMKRQGYFTYHHGKRGNTAQAIQAQFDVNKYLKNDDSERKSGEPGREIVDEAIQFWNEKKDAKPVFMYLAFGNPHDPRVAAKKYLDQYQRDQIPLMKNYLPVHPFDNGELLVRDEQLSPWPRTEAEIRKTLHEYYATITAMDFHIGRLIAALKEMGQFESTLFIFSADQGIAVGSHGLLGKQNIYDHSMKVPLVFAGPGIPQGQSDAMVYLFDVLPTIAEYCGTNPKVKLDGQSFLPVLTKGAKVARSELMLAYRGVQRAIRDERFKLIRYPQINTTQLFDLQTDPDELKNLVEEPTHQDRLKTMMKRLEALQKQFGDALPLSTPSAGPARTITAEELTKRAKK